MSSASKYVHIYTILYNLYCNITKVCIMFVFLGHDIMTPLGGILIKWNYDYQLEYSIVIANVASPNLTTTTIFINVHEFYTLCKNLDVLILSRICLGVELTVNGMLCLMHLIANVWFVLETCKLSLCLVLWWWIWLFWFNVK